MVENSREAKPPMKGPGRAGSPSMCLTDEEIEAHVLSRLPAGATEAVEEHLLYCTSCLDRVEEEERFSTAFRAAARAREAELRAGAAAKGWLAWLRGPYPVWAGALAMGLALCLIVPWNRQPEPAQAVRLSVVRGSEPAPAGQAVAGRPVRLEIDTTELPRLSRYHLQLVNPRNEALSGKDVEPAGGKLVWEQETLLAPGAYWVRLYDSQAGGVLLREFGLSVK